jgi:hypothetical protein
MKKWKSENIRQKGRQNTESKIKGERVHRVLTENTLCLQGVKYCLPRSWCKIETLTSKYGALEIKLRIVFSSSLGRPDRPG